MRGGQLRLRRHLLPVRCLMVRRYIPKRQPWRNKDRRRARVAELRENGLSIRQIAEQIGVGVGTVHRDLARWADDHANVATLPQPQESPSGGVWSARDGGVLLEDRSSRVPSERSKSPRQRGETEHPNGTPAATVIQIRRSS